MKYFDSHCHLDIPPLSEDQEAAIKRASKSGVETIINVGSSLKGSRTSVELAEKYPNVWASVGLHPHEAGAITDFDSTIDEIRDLAKRDKVIAIGEIGLDFYSDQGSVTSDQKKNQLKLFRLQLELAAELKLPVILHVRDAWEEAYDVISRSSLASTDESGRFVIRNSGRPPGVVHCYTAGPKEAKRWLDLGFYIGFTGFVTFEQSKFDEIREAAKLVPLERILIETDAPFLAPEPHRGKTNEPAYVVETAKKIAELKERGIAEVAEVTYKNTEKVFNCIMY